MEKRFLLYSGSIDYKVAVDYHYCRLYYTLELIQLDTQTVVLPPSTREIFIVLKASTTNRHDGVD
jgi:hypothetical protein